MPRVEVPAVAVDSTGGVAAAGPPELSVRALALLAAVLANGPGRLAHVTVRGWSMAPLLIDGDIATLEPIRGRPSLGNVVVARNRLGEPVCQRVVARSGGGFVLAGDGAAGGEWHPRESLVGQVVEISRARRRLLLGRALRRPGDVVQARWHGWAIHWRRSRWRLVRLLGRVTGGAVRMAGGWRSRLAWLAAGRARADWRPTAAVSAAEGGLPAREPPLASDRRQADQQPARDGRSVG